MSDQQRVGAGDGHTFVVDSRSLEADNARLRTCLFQAQEAAKNLVQQSNQLRAQIETWRSLYRRAVSVANGLTNYVEERPELRRAERELTTIETEARAAIDAAKQGGGNG